MNEYEFEIFYEGRKMYTSELSLSKNWLEATEEKIRKAAARKCYALGLKNIYDAEE